MPEFTVKQTVRCGELTCASEPGVFCTFVGSVHFGQHFECLLFMERLYAHHDGENAGWLARCQPCLKAEKEPADA